MAHDFEEELDEKLFAMDEEGDDLDDVDVDSEEDEPDLPLDVEEEN